MSRIDPHRFPSTLTFSCFSIESHRDHSIKVVQIPSSGCVYDTGMILWKIIMPYANDSCVVLWKFRDVILVIFSRRLKNKHYGVERSIPIELCPVSFGHWTWTVSLDTGQVPFFPCTIHVYMGHAKSTKAETSIIFFFFPFEHVIDSHKKWPTAISRLKKNFSGSNGRNCRFGTESRYRFFWNFKRKLKKQIKNSGSEVLWPKWQILESCSSLLTAKKR